MISKLIEKHIILLTFLTGCGNGGSNGLLFKLIPGPQGEQGATGAQGAAGQDGNNGLDGVGCSVTQVSLGDLVLPNGGAIVLCGASSALISNGAAGTNGSNGTNGLDALPTAYSIVDMKDPCGNSPGIYDEVLLKLGNGTLVASFSDNANGLNTRLSVLVPGTFTTTDGSHCTFSVDINNNVYNEHF